jgi:hypothetical protein
MVHGRKGCLGSLAPSPTLQRPDLGSDELLRLFIVITMLQPTIPQRLQYARSRHISRIEQERGSRVIRLARRQKTITFLSFRMVRCIDGHDAKQQLASLPASDPPGESGGKSVRAPAGPVAWCEPTQSP